MKKNTRLGEATLMALYCVCASVFALGSLWALVAAMSWFGKDASLNAGTITMCVLLSGVISVAALLDEDNYSQGFEGWSTPYPVVNAIIYGSVSALCGTYFVGATVMIIGLFIPNASLTAVFVIMGAVGVIIFLVSAFSVIKNPERIHEPV